jgi:hypothetical protein
MNRLELIKAAAEKSERRRNLKARIGPSRIGELTAQAGNELDGRRAKAAKFDAVIDAMDENHNHWTDSAKYAEEFYGEVKNQTTKLDNDWD